MAAPDGSLPSARLHAGTEDVVSAPAPAAGGAGTTRPAPVGGRAESDSDEELEVQQFKVIVLGDGAVGKSSMLQRFSSDTFGKMYKQTVGVDWTSKKIELPGPVHCTLQCWDIGGQNIGGKMLRNYIFGSHAVVLAYDITNPDSFANLEDWLAECRAVFKDAMPYLALVGNKTDLGHLRTVKPQRHKDFADASGMHSFFVSAKTGDNVAAMFYRIAADLAGVTLTKPELQVAAKVVPATIINHAKDDPTVEAPPIGARKTAGRTCSVM